MTTPMIRKRLSLQVDLVFKALFGQDTEQSKTLLIDLLNTILDPSPQELITSIHHKNPFNLQTHPDDKYTILDIKVKTQSGDLIDIEMQMVYQAYFHKRSLYYWSKLHSEQLQTSETFSKIRKSICINLVSYKAIENTRDSHTRYLVLDDKNHNPLCDDLEIHYIQLPNINDTIDVEVMDRFTEWMTLIKDIHLPEKDHIINKIVKKEGVLQMAYDEYSKINQDELHREQLEARQKFIWDMNTEKEVARIEGLALGKAEGLAEGKAEGKAEGLAKGKAEGLAEGISEEKHATALRLLKESIPIEIIIKATNLSQEEITQIQKNIN